MEKPVSKKRSEPDEGNHATKGLILLTCTLHCRRNLRDLPKPKLLLRMEKPVSKERSEPDEGEPYVAGHKPMMTVGVS